MLLASCTRESKKGRGRGRGRCNYHVTFVSRRDRASDYAGMRIIKKMSKGALSSLEKGSGLRKQYSPWTCREEWELVYTWLYSSRPQLIRKGVNRVAAWKSRGGVPMMVEMTANLCECRVQEKMEGGGVHFQALILQYSIAVTRYKIVLQVSCNNGK